MSVLKILSNNINIVTKRIEMGVKEQPKLLIISYYWPPSGGAGVQRWLKLSKYLSEMGLEVHVLTVDEKASSYTHIDPSLLQDVHPNVKVHKTKSFEINNIYGRIVGKKNIPTAGFSNVDNTSFFQKLVNAIRSNFFIPDPRIGWKPYAVKAAKKIIKQASIDTVITSSPPHSVQLIGRTLKRTLKINWIADLRDPWTDIYYYGLLGHSKYSKEVDKALEKSVLEEADHLLTVSYGVQELFLEKSENISESKFSIVYNGFDQSDFSKKINDRETQKFTISYIGTMSDQYQPGVALEAIKALDEVYPDCIKLRFVGSISENIHKALKNSGLSFETVGQVPHSEVASYQQSADLLLLFIPEVPNNKGIITGKLFEYLASGNLILGLGPSRGDIARILSHCNAGEIFERTEKKEIYQFLRQAFEMHQNGEQHQSNQAEIQKFSREAQAKDLYKLIKEQL